MFLFVYSKDKIRDGVQELCSEALFSKCSLRLHSGQAFFCEMQGNGLSGL